MGFISFFLTLDMLCIQHISSQIVMISKSKIQALILPLKWEMTMIVLRLAFSIFVHSTASKQTQTNK